MDSDNEDYVQFNIHEGIIFLIELNDDMYRKLPQLEGLYQLKEILSNINDLVQELIITLPNTGVGIYFYNSETSYKKFPQRSNLDRVFRLNDLNSTNMKILHDLITDDKVDFPTIAADEKRLPIVLNTILDEFNTKPYNTKKLIWMTNNDQPFTSEPIKSNLWKIINDYEQFRIGIIPIFLDSYDKQMNLKPFNMKPYEDIFINTNYLRNPITYSIIQAKINNEDSKKISSLIKSSILRLKEIKRIQFACDLVLSDSGTAGGNFGCSIKGYTLYNHEKIKKLRHLHDTGDSLKIVELSSKFKTQSGEEIFIPQGKKPMAERKNDAGIRSGFSVGNGKVLYLDNKQMASLKNYAFDHILLDADELSDYDGVIFKPDEDNFDDEQHYDSVAFSKPPYLKLIGFREISRFKPYFNLGAPLFVTADMKNGGKDGGYENSFSTFKELYNSCYRLKKFAILFGCTKSNALPNLYAFYPTHLPKSTHYKFAQGFLLIRMPWIDDIRVLPDHILKDESLQFDKEDGEAGNIGLKRLQQGMEQMISRLKWSTYDPNEFSNPSLNYFYKVMRQELLQIGNDEIDNSLETNDQTIKILQNVKEILQQDEKLMNGIKQELSKYGQVNDDVGPEQKKQKLYEIDEKAIIAAWKTEQLDLFTIPQLRLFANKYKPKIKSASKKDDLINNIVEFLNSR